MSAYWPPIVDSCLRKRVKSSGFALCAFSVVFGELVDRRFEPFLDGVSGQPRSFAMALLESLSRSLRRLTLPIISMTTFLFCRKIQQVSGTPLVNFGSELMLLRGSRRETSTCLRRTPPSPYLEYAWLELAKNQTLRASMTRDRRSPDDYVSASRTCGIA